MPALRLIGPGRAGTSLAAALARVGWDVREPFLGRGADVHGAAHGTDALVIATPDAAIAELAAAVEPDPDTVVMHMAGSLGIDVLEPHPKRAGLHPLAALPDEDTGAHRLSEEGVWYAVEGDPMARAMVDDLHGHAIEVDADHRVLYHAAAVIASNHVVALLGQVERVAALAGVPLEAYDRLVRATVDNVAKLGPAAALTGPVARGDWTTVERHIAALPEDERPAYQAMVREAARCR
ncbi:MAG: hypothetical protein QOK43_1252 [Acidimicrobiaceae bacterium]|nr:hypothetical protein [Acidimicrobiaceae bacterium]